MDNPEPVGLIDLLTEIEGHSFSAIQIKENIDRFQSIVLIVRVAKGPAAFERINRITPCGLFPGPVSSPLRILRL